ncbi:MAG: DUF4271 domain-containing protein [Bacteroidales bacterium]|nr:DUF4271 domain-containing protein [Bacteroidales bacterium]
MDIMPVLVRETDWNSILVLGVSLVIILLQIGIKLTFPDYYKSVIYRMTVENLSGRQANNTTEASSLLAVTSAITFLTISMAIYEIIAYSGRTSVSPFFGYEWSVFLFIFIGVTAFNFCKLIINKIIGNLFHIEKEAANYNTLIIDTEKITALFIFPIAAFCPFVPINISRIFIWILLGISGLLLVFQYVTFFLHLLKNKFLNHYSILYFCSLEILPILVLIHLGF